MADRVARTALVILSSMMCVLPSRVCAASLQSPANSNSVERSQSSSPPDKAKSQDSQPSGQETSTLPEPAADDAKTENRSKGGLHFRLGAITLEGSYVHLPNSPCCFYPLYGPFYPYVYPVGLAWNSFLYDPIYSPFYSLYTPDLAYGLDKGQVKLSAESKTAEVYLDDAYAGQAGHLKSMWLHPGAYDLKVRSSDGAVFHQRIYVLSGKTVKIKAALVPQGTQETVKEEMEKQP